MAAAISTSHQKIAILLYDDRSGSTLFASLLAKHPKVAVTIEGELFAHIFSLPAKALCEDDVRAALDAISNDVKLRNWRIDRNKVIEGFRRLSSSCRRKDFAKLLLEDVVNGLNPNAAVCVFKHGNINYVNRYKALFPEAHFLHIYRDGRAVYASKKRARHSVRNKPMANNPIQAARAWADLMREVELLRGSERFLEIQYEALLHDPERKLRKVCKFLGIDEEPFVGGVGAGDKTGYLEEIPEEQK
ncbi:MAG: sulfotransferase, partial [bacterium]|nr:sulfotransferase [bacterium]